MVTRIVKLQCSNCRYWRQIEGGNMGHCMKLLHVGAQDVPMWARKLSGVTISWEGEGCLAFADKRAHKTKLKLETDL